MQYHEIPPVHKEKGQLFTEYKGKRSRWVESHMSWTAARPHLVEQLGELDEVDGGVDGGADGADGDEVLAPP